LAKSGPQRRFPLAATLLALLVVAGIVGMAVKYYHYATSPPTDSIAFRHALFYPGKLTRPLSGLVEGWREVRLPHDWQDAEVDSRQGWYALEIGFKVPPNRLWGIYLPRVTSNVLAYINGKAVGRGGRFRDPVARNGNRPLYFSIPNSFLTSGANRIVLHVKTAAGKHGYLGPVYLGADETLRPVFERLFYLRVNVVEITTASLVLVAVLMLGVWSVRRGDSLALWFALICIAWAVHNLNLLVVEIPVSIRAWECLRYLSVGWFAVLLIIFMRRMLGLQHRKLEYAIFTVVFVASLALCSVTDIDSFFRFANQYWTPGALLLSVYTVTRIPVAWWKTRDTEYFVAMCAGFPVFLVGVHDWMHLNGYISHEHGLLLQYSAATLLLGFIVILLMRYARALTESENLMHTLEDRVEERGRQLESNYQELRKLEHDRVLSRERERIMRDMHDGVGGHLVSALAMAERTPLEAGRFRELLGNALMDLRLMIDSLDQTEGDLTAVLGMLRSRLHPVLEESGIEVRWEVRDIPAIPNPGPGRILQIMRILQEAITNVIKHADANVLVVETGQRDDAVFIEIRDDGKGLQDSRPGGRGLRNMYYRASQAGIDLDIEDTSPGTCIRLTVPLGTLDPQ